MKAVARLISICNTSPRVMFFARRIAPSATLTLVGLRMCMLPRVAAAHLPVSSFSRATSVSVATMSSAVFPENAASRATLVFPMSSGGASSALLSKCSSSMAASIRSGVASSKLDKRALRSGIRLEGMKWVAIPCSLEPLCHEN